MTRWSRNIGSVRSEKDGYGRGSWPPDALMFLASLLPRYLAPSALLAFLPRWYLLSFTFLPQRGLSAGTCFRLLLSLGATCPRIAVPPRPSIAFLPRHHSFSSTSSRGATCPSIAFLLRRHLFSYASLLWRCLSLDCLTASLVFLCFPPVALPVPRLSYGATCFRILPSLGDTCPSIAFLLRRHLFSYASLHASLPWRCLSLDCLSPTAPLVFVYFPPVALPDPRLLSSHGDTCFRLLSSPALLVPRLLSSYGVTCFRLLSSHGATCLVFDCFPSALLYSTCFCLLSSFGATRLLFTVVS
ncbi:hypothetical protein BGY98DRAFT_225169 [Russula aff. rugulosa BPL654]|nr:hypothetical protein BGY98DRAFT_225169 [Russula aff. rugulosa BPL654]